MEADHLVGNCSKSIVSPRFLGYFLALCLLPFSPQARAENNSHTGSGTYVYRDEYLLSSQDPHRRRLDPEIRLVTVGSARKRGNRTIVEFNAEKALSDCKLIGGNASEVLCEPNFVRFSSLYPDDKKFAAQWALYSEVDLYNLNAPLAWQLTTGSHDVVVGILDTGVNFLHPDLAPNIWKNPAEIPLNGVDDDQNGYVDDFHGVHTVHQGAEPWDCDGHGSHVAGIIGSAGNNKIGVTGVNWNIQMIPVGLSACSETPSFGIYEIVQGINYLIETKRRYNLHLVAVNASFSGAGASSAEKAAIERLQEEGILLVAAAGNSGADIDVWKSYPASYGLENIVAVTAATRYGERAGFANYGPTTVDLAAPGVNILSTFASQFGNDEQYEVLSGTSMAAPFVTGAIALLSSLRPEYSPVQILERLKLSAKILPELDGQVEGSRALDLGALLSMSSDISVDESDLSTLLLRYSRRARHALRTTAILVQDDLTHSTKSRGKTTTHPTREAQRSLEVTLRRLQRLSREIQWLSSGLETPALRLKRVSRRAVILYRKSRKDRNNAFSQSFQRASLQKLKNKLHRGILIAHSFSLMKPL